MNSAPYQVTLSASAQRDLLRPPEKIATAAVEFIYGTLAENPYRVGRALRLDRVGHHAARRGDYRVVYRIDEPGHVLLIVTIDHRADAYRPRSRGRST